MGVLPLALFLTLLCSAKSQETLELSASTSSEAPTAATLSPYGPKGDLHALLVAGSNGWWNYRHQADVAHAYHVLLRQGVPPDNIIVMMYDDIANDPDNPYPGKLFNRPHGPDVYQGLKIDYSNDSVNPQNFLNVLQGNAKGVVGGNKRVIKSKPDDRIFVYFTDHGGTGLICFPDDVLSVDDLNTALEKMYHKKSYGQFVFYLEACESGSMFDGVLRKDINIYAVTAANPDESSWGTYCDNDMNLPCLGDLFSVNWMQDSERHDVKTETLLTQFKDVRKLTNLSHVMRYGDLHFTKEPVSWFEGGNDTETSTLTAYDDEDQKVSWPSRDIELMHLESLRRSANDATTSHVLGQRIAKIHEDRRNIEAVVKKLVAKLLLSVNDRKEMIEKRNPIKDLKCHNDVAKAFDSICVDVNKFDYALKYIYVLNNLCVKIGDSKKIIKAMHRTCSTIGKQYL